MKTPSREWYEQARNDPRAVSPHRCGAVDMLEPVTREGWIALQEAARAAGIDLRLIETWRSQARQYECFLNGRSKLKKVGTHGFGLAFDVGIYVGGVLAQHEEPYRALPALCRPLGLVSGCDWGAPGLEHTWVDPDHVQRIAVSEQRRLFAGDWYPDESYSPYGLAIAAPSTPAPVQQWEEWNGVPYA